MGLDLLQRFERQLDQRHEVSQPKAGHRSRSATRYSGISSPAPASLIEDGRLRLAQMEQTELPALESAVRFGNPQLAHQARAALGWQIAGVRQAMRDAVAAGGELSDVAQMSAALETIEARVARLVVAGEGDEGVTETVIERAPDIASRLGLPALPVQLDAIGARTARAHGTRGVAQSGVVHLDLAGLTQRDALELLAHEAVHVAQGRLEGEPQPELAEAEAAFLAHELVSSGSLRRPRHPVASAAAMRDDRSAQRAQARHPLPWLTETVLCSLLEQSVAGGDMVAAQGRAEALCSAFATLDPAVRSDLHARLSAPARGDRLAELFRGRLSSATRHRLLAGLGQVAAHPAAQTSTAAPASGRAPATSDAREDTWRAVLGEASTSVGKMGRVEAPRGLRLHTGPSSGTPHTAILPFDTMVHVERKTTHGWYYVIALGDARGGDSVSGTGCVEGQFVELDPPEPTAHLHHVKPGEMLKDIASLYYETGDGFEWGDDARLYVEALWEANKGTDKLLRVGGELSAAETLLRSEKVEKTLEIWKSARPKAGHAIWIPSRQFIAGLKKAGAISSGSMSHAAWETAKRGVQALVDFLQYGAGFVVGAIEGISGALRDLLMGVPDLLGLLYDLFKALVAEGIIGTTRSIIGKLRDLFENAPDLLLQAGNWFAKQWNQEDDFDRGSFHGEVIGYVLAQVFILFATMGGSSALLATGRFSGFIKVIQKLDAASDFLSFAGRASKTVKVPDKVGDAVRHAHGGALRVGGGSTDGAGDVASRMAPELETRASTVPRTESTAAEQQASLTAATTRGAATEAERKGIALLAELKTVPMAPGYLGEHLPGNPIWGTQVTYLSSAERQVFKLHIRDGKLFDAEGNLFDTADAASVHSGGGGRAIAVMDADGNLYASKYQEVGKFHHSSLTAGEPVAYAGEIKVEGGVLTEISNRSGHYRPPQASVDQARLVLESLGVDFSTLKQIKVSSPSFPGE